MKGACVAIEKVEGVVSVVEITRLLLLVIHFVGLAAVVGPFLIQLQLQSGFRLRWMLVGAIAQVVTGNLLIVMRRFGDLEVDEGKMLLKLILAALALGAVIVAMVVQRRARRSARPDSAARVWMLAAGVLALAAVVVAVAWA